MCLQNYTMKKQHLKDRGVRIQHYRGKKPLTGYMKYLNTYSTALYTISVRRASALPAASFSQYLTILTLPSG
jgi:hypothetical protein